MSQWVIQLALMVTLSAPGNINPHTGLIEAAGADLVTAHCSGCHSLKLVTQNRGSRDDWIRTIRWMQATQNLWSIPAETESKIVQYLATHYGAVGYSRRPPLHPSLMPSAAANNPPKLLPAQGSSSTRVSGHERVRDSANLGPAETLGCACDATSKRPSSGVMLALSFFLWRLLSRYRVWFDKARG